MTGATGSTGSTGASGATAAGLPRTAERQVPPRPVTPAWLRDTVRRIETSAGLDGPVAAVARVADSVLADPRVDGALRGDWAGHALHPLLTDFPLGAFLSATLLDLFGGRRARPAATGLVGFGLAMTVPTAAAGLAEWRSAGHTARRVGIVHASVNGTAALLYGASLAARLRGRHGRGVLLALGGGSAAWVGGYLGGHLSLVRKVGTADPSFGPADGAR